MKIEQSDAGYNRCWLSSAESETIVEQYSDDPKKYLALRLMLDSGLRVSEVANVSRSDITETDADYHLLTIPEAKYGARQTLLPSETAQLIRMVSNTLELGKNDRIIDVTERTVRNWVHRAAESIDHPNATDVSPHDLRRTWATRLVHAGVPSDTVMDWGGWTDHGTFRSHYWSLSDEQIQNQLENADVI